MEMKLGSVFLTLRVMVGSFLGWESTDVFSFLQLMENQFFFCFVLVVTSFGDACISI